jgi:glycosyltransferase involved in cell wall biosynthesis
MMSLISIVVPIYGTEDYLPQCLESILGQHHENIEVLCVDDCTPDKAVDIVLDFADRDKRVKLLQHETNQGLGPARNTGIKAATGDLIGFVDSDDWIEPEMFRVLFDVMQQEDADIVQCSAARMQDGRNIGSYPESAGVRGQFVMHSMFGNEPRLVGAAWNKLYKTRLFRDNNIYYPPILFEDVATTPRLVHMSKRVASVSESYLNYRYRDDSIVNSVNPATLIKRVDGLFSASEILANFFMLRNAHSLEFILNFRRYLIPQIERNIRIAGKLEDEGNAQVECLNTIRTHFLRMWKNGAYFFPDSSALLERFQAQSERTNG